MALLSPPPHVILAVGGDPDIKISGVSRYPFGGEAGRIFYWIPAFFNPDEVGARRAEVKRQ